MANDDDCDDNKNVCLAACVYKNQNNCDKLSKLITNCGKEANPEKSPKSSKRSRDENIMLILSRKSRNPGILQKFRPENPGI